MENLNGIHTHTAPKCRLYNILTLFLLFAFRVRTERSRDRDERVYKKYMFALILNSTYVVNTNVVF